MTTKPLTPERLAEIALGHRRVANQIGVGHPIDVQTRDDHRAIGELLAEVRRLQASSDSTTIDDMFAEAFGVFLVSRNPDNWQARGPQRDTVSAAEHDRDVANNGLQARQDLVEACKQRDKARAEAAALRQEKRLKLERLSPTPRDPEE